MSVVQETDGYLVGEDDERGHVGVLGKNRVVVNERMKWEIEDGAGRYPRDLKSRELNWSLRELYFVASYSQSRPLRLFKFYLTDVRMLRCTDVEMYGCLSFKEISGCQFPYLFRGKEAPFICPPTGAHLPKRTWSSLVNYPVHVM